MSADILAKLAAPFPPEKIEWRVGSTTKDKSRGLALAYIDARTVQDRLNEACGPFWQTKHHHCGGEKLGCDIGIKFGDEWLWRGDGAGQTDVEGDKGAFSDAFKRAAVRWGVGRYLYDLDSPWVELERRGNSYVIAAAEMPRLARLLAGHPMRDPIVEKLMPVVATAIGSKLSIRPSDQPKPLVRAPAGTQTVMPQGAMIEPIAPGQVHSVEGGIVFDEQGIVERPFVAKAPADPAKRPYQARRPMGGPAPSLLQRALTEADKGSFAYEHLWTMELSAEERKEIGADTHSRLKELASIADQRAGAV